MEALTNERDLAALMLRAVLEQYATPDEKVVSKLPKKNNSTGQTAYLDYVGHADITRMLIEIDPLWNWEPVAWENGRPQLTMIGGSAVMWGRMTLLGKTLLGVGSVETVRYGTGGTKIEKSDVDKELVGDFLRNAAMRFGLCLSLWTKSDWDTSTHPSAAAPTTQPVRLAVVRSEGETLPPADSGQVADTVARLVEVFNADEVFSEGTTKTRPTAAEPVALLTGTVGLSAAQKGLVSKLSKEKCDGDITSILREMFNTGSLNDLSKQQGSALIKHLIAFNMESF